MCDGGYRSKSPRKVFLIEWAIQGHHRSCNYQQGEILVCRINYMSSQMLCYPHDACVFYRSVCVAKHNILGLGTLVFGPNDKLSFIHCSMPEQASPSVFRHFDRPIIDDPSAACSTHCYSVAVERFSDESSAVTRPRVCLTAYQVKPNRSLQFVIYEPWSDY